MSEHILTAKLAVWLHTEISKGCAPDTLVAELVRTGYTHAFASTVVDNAMHALTAMQSIKGGGSPLDAYLHANAATGNTMNLDGHIVDIVFSARDPRIILFANVLSDAECDALIAEAKSRMKRAEVVNPETGQFETDPARTSDAASFQRGQTPLVALIEKRIEQLVSWPVNHGEGLQILHYRPGGEYQPHYDYFDPKDAGSATQLAHGGQRIATLVIYLNNVIAGGSTVFPNVGIETMPRKGSAVFFAYAALDGSLDTRSLHAGTPVVAGEKWIATKWLRQREYR